MPIDKLLHPESIELQSSIASADGVLRRISELVSRNPLASGLAVEEIFLGLKEREKLGSTGLGKGMAIPHFATDQASDFVIGLLTLTDPIDFQSIDGTPSDLFIFVIGPRDQRDRHIKLLSSIAKFASRPDSLKGLRNASDPAAVHDLLLRHIVDDHETEGKERVLFYLFVQDLKIFEDTLHLLSTAVPGSVSVIETRNAGAYLFAMPLFAAFWTEKSTQEGRIILAVVDKRRTNSLIRQIQEITGDPDKQPGVLLAVQDLTYVAGSIAF